MNTRIAVSKARLRLKLAVDRHAAMLIRFPTPSMAEFYPLLIYQTPENWQEPPYGIIEASVKIKKVSYFEI